MHVNRTKLINMNIWLFQAPCMHPMARTWTRKDFSFQINISTILADLAFVGYVWPSRNWHKFQFLGQKTIFLVKTQIVPIY